MTANLEIEIEVTPAFCEVDPMEVVWHGHYVAYLERARAALLARQNFGYHDMRDAGYAFPVIDLHIRYAQPLVLGQRVKVRARIVEWESRLRVLYEIRDSVSGRRLTRAHTVQVAVNLSTRALCYVCPAVLWERLGVAPS
jgi:acyl-CoA thioester hydrolase